MPRAQRLSIDQRRARLLELGLSLFSQRAYDQVSTDDIALAGGVSKGLLYHYFANKRGYYVATVRELAERVVEATELPEGVPFDQAIRVALQRFVGCIRDNATFYRTLMRGGEGVDDEDEGLFRIEVKHVHGGPPTARINCERGCSFGGI